MSDHDTYSLLPLASTLRTEEQMRWIHDRFKIDGLERLARADRDYADSHGVYLPDVAALAHAAITQLEDEREMAKQVIDDLRDLRLNWRRIVDEQDPDGGPLIENILYWAIEDLCGDNE